MCWNATFRHVQLSRSCQSPQIRFYGFLFTNWIIWPILWNSASVFLKYWRVLYLTASSIFWWQDSTFRHVLVLSIFTNLILWLLHFGPFCEIWRLSLQNIGEFYTWQPPSYQWNQKVLGGPDPILIQRLARKLRPMTRPRKVKVIMSIKRDWGKIRVRLRKD